MKSDLDSLLKANNLTALIVSGSSQHNPSMYYFTGDVFLTTAVLIKKQGHAPVLFCGPMEREEAVRTGYSVTTITDFDLRDAGAHHYQYMLSQAGVDSGRVSIYGQRETGKMYTIFSKLQELMPEIEIIGEVERTILLQARETKDEGEIARIRRMGEKTVEIVAQVAEFLQSHSATDGILVKKDGEPLTIREVKTKINQWVVEREVENPHGVIFAIGHDAGVPHSVGNSEDTLRLGETIIFDIFLQEPGSGYHYDFTRTWCLGHAPEAAQALYDDVYAVYQQIISELELNAPGKMLQLRTCELFEQRGYPTQCQDAKSIDGYVHGLGHGIGLNVHEKPSLGRFATESDLLRPGSVVTIEPGLYYPDKNLGCRIEDTVYVNPNGEIETLAEYPYDFVLPVKGD